MLVPPHPPLTDGVVILRPHSRDDVPAIVDACQDPEIARWTLVPAPYTEDDALEWLELAAEGWRSGREASFVMLDADSELLLGAIGARLNPWPVADLGYWVAAHARGRGVAARGARLLARWAFDELGSVRAEIVTDVDNVASQRVAEKAGFRREGVLRQRLEVKGRRSDCVMFSLLPADLDPGR